MKISFIIPTKDGGEGFNNLLSSIRKNIIHCQEQGFRFSYNIKILINGDPHKTLKCVNDLSNKDDLDILLIEKPGKVLAINTVIKDLNSEYVVILDDDIYFNKELLLLALNEVSRNKEIDIVSFQNRAIPLNSHNPVRKFIYDIINVRSLKDIYSGIDPFLIGRFILIKRKLFNVPGNIINEDLYLGIMYADRYVIRPEEIYYIGESNILRHIKRVLRLEAGRAQIKHLFGLEYDRYLDKNPRIINYDKLHSLSLYYRVCYYCYKILRFLTNSLISKIFKHKTNHW